MKLPLSGILPKVAVIGAATFLFASNSTAADAAKTASTTSLAGLKAGVEKVSGQIGVTVGALESAKEAAKKGGDFRKELGTFSQSYTNLETELETLRANVITMKAKAKQHFDSWEKELEGLQNPKFRGKAADRLAEEKRQFEKIIERGEDARAAFTPFLADLKDIKTMLDIDPTDEAMSTLSNSIWKLGNQSKTVISRLNAVVKQIDKAMGIPK